MLESSIDVIEKKDENLIDVSFEEILSGYEVEKEIEVGIETEPLCGSCFAPLDVDEDQTSGYCDRCETIVFVERRILGHGSSNRNDFDQLPANEHAQPVADIYPHKGCGEGDGSFV